VTVPHRQTSLAHLDGLAPSAGRIGAVNTVVREARGTLIGHNTDGTGFLEPLTERLGFEPAGRRAVLLGAGGAARAVAAALLEADVGRLTILNRTVARAETLAAELAEFETTPDTEIRVGPLEEPVSHPDLDHCDLLVQCTSRGIGEEPPVAVAWDRLPATAIAADLVYGRGPTPFLAAAQGRGLATHDGIWMLLGQAAETFRLWTGQRFDLDTVYAHLRAGDD
jgi:shikimate dehydrogenase